MTGFLFCFVFHFFLSLNSLAVTGFTDIGLPPPPTHTLCLELIILGKDSVSDVCLLLYRALRFDKPPKVGVWKLSYICWIFLQLLNLQSPRTSDTYSLLPQRCVPVKVRFVCIKQNYNYS